MCQKWPFTSSWKTSSSLTAVWRKADEALLKKPKKGLADGRRTLLIERESGAVPVAGGAEVAKLTENSSLVLLLPGPDPLHQSLAAEIVPGEFFLFEEPPLDHRLGGDARVVGAGHPERAIPLHPPGPDDDVLERVVEGVAQVERACHIRRRDHDREHRPGRLAGGRRLGVPGAEGIPEVAAAGLRGPVVIVLGEFGHEGNVTG
jgi:hypothetical protein